MIKVLWLATSPSLADSKVAARHKRSRQVASFRQDLAAQDDWQAASAMLYRSQVSEEVVEVGLTRVTLLVRLPVNFTLSNGLRVVAVSARIFNSLWLCCC